MVFQRVPAAIAACLALAGAPSAAPALSILDFDGADIAGTSFDVGLAGGALAGTVATFTDPVTGGGGSAFNDFGALCIGGASCQDSFDVVFDATVQWVGGETGTTQSGFPGFDVTGPGVAATAVFSGGGGGVTADTPPAGGFLLDTALTFEAGETYSFARSGSGSALVTFEAWTFEEVAVPLPPAAGLLVAALAALGALARRRA